jgi:hypothetical protein
LYQGLGVRQFIVFTYLIGNLKLSASHLAHTDSSPILTVLFLQTDSLR